MTNTLYVRTKIEGKGWRYQAIKEGRGKKTGELKPPFYARPFVINSEGVRAQQWRKLGAETFTQAKKEADALAKGIEAQRAGLTVQEVESLSDGSTRLSNQVTRYLAEVQANRARKTWLAYTNSLRYFKSYCKKTLVDEITRADMLGFKNFLRKRELSGRSVYNNFLNVMTFFVWCKRELDALEDWHLKLSKEDWPKKPEREPEAYTNEELNALLKAADDEERLLLRSFLYSGLRSGEMSHLTYGDLDFRHSVWTVRPKADHSLKTKAAQRDVTVPPELTAKIAVRMKKMGKTARDLIFPNTLGGPNGHLIRIVKRVAKRAGVTGRVDDHKFRSTAITNWLKKGFTVAEVMGFVGHTDPKIVMDYAEKARVRSAEVRAKVSETFERFEGVGD